MCRPCAMGTLRSHSPCQSLTGARISDKSKPHTRRNRIISRANSPSRKASRAFSVEIAATSGRSRARRSLSGSSLRSVSRKRARLAPARRAISVNSHGVYWASWKAATCPAVERAESRRASDDIPVPGPIVLLASPSEPQTEADHDESNNNIVQRCPNCCTGEHPWCDQQP